MHPYTEDFYENQRERSRQSAREIVPLVLELTGARSVVDVGCGVGTWLAVFREHGVEDVLGIDGDYVDRTMLEIPAHLFVARDLAGPVRLNRQFDLAVSLEVAEHLPAECAGTLVASLASLAPAVLFSAAIPFQGGTGHVNERWPEYWAARFREEGYVVVDCIRRKVWRNRNVASWYAQNTLLFARPDYVESRPLLKEELASTDPMPLAVVHPRRYLYLADPRNMPLGRVLAALPALFAKALGRRLRRARRALGLPRRAASRPAGLGSR